jgi:hypothetical protein
VDRGPGVSVWLSFQGEWEAYPRRRAFNLVPCQDDDGYHLTEQLVFKHERERQQTHEDDPKTDSSRRHPQSVAEVFDPPGVAHSSGDRIIGNLGAFRPAFPSALHNPPTSKQLMRWGGSCPSNQPGDHWGFGFRRALFQQRPSPFLPGQGGFVKSCIENHHFRELKVALSGHVEVPERTEPAKRWSDLTRHEETHETISSISRRAAVENR